MGNKKIGIVGILQNPSKSLNHHNGGWTQLIVKQLNYAGHNVEVLTEKDDWNAYDELYFLHGVNYRYGVYNLFGGVSDQLLSRINKFLDFDGPCYSLNDKFPNLMEICEKRSIGIDVPEERLEMSILNMPNVHNKVVIGDSHSISVCPEDHCIYRNDGKTLNGALDIGIKNLMWKHDPTPKELIVYFGNIDIRFHLPRLFPNFEDAKAGIRIMLKNLVDQLQEMEQDGLQKITLVHVLPIEDESRKIPGTGKHDGNNFYGSWEYRNRLRNKFNEMLDYCAEYMGADIIKWPDHFTDSDGKMKFDVMESRQSVHLRPKFYKTNNYGK